MTIPFCTPRFFHPLRLAAALLAVLPLGMPAANAQQRLATISRYANQCDEYLVRGDAAVTPSPAFKNGLRLAAWDGADLNDTTRVALASAIYFIPLPAGTRGIRIDVGYRRNPGATRPEAGFLFIRDPRVEQAYDAPDDGPADNPLAEEPVFYGRTSPLPGNAPQAQLVIGTDGLLSDQNVLELHLAAGAGQVMDVDYLQITAYANYQAPAAQVSQQVVLDQPYAYSYNYYYAGPWMSWTPAACTYYTFNYPTTPPFCFGGWWVWRSCYWNQHPWACRPVSFTHCVPWPGPGVPYAPYAYTSGTANLMLPGFGVPSYRQNWYRRHFRVDAAKTPPEQLYRDVRHRRSLLPPERQPGFVHQAAAVDRHVADADRELRKELGGQMSQQAARWRAQPRLAHQDMKQLQDKSPAFRQTMRHLAIPDSPPPPAATAGGPATPATIPAGAAKQTGIIMPLSIKPAAGGAPNLIPVGGTAGPSLLPPPRLSASQSRSSSTSVPATRAATVAQPAVTPAQHTRTTFTPTSEKPADLHPLKRSHDKQPPATSRPEIRDEPQKAAKPVTPVSAEIHPANRSRPPLAEPVSSAGAWEDSGKAMKAEHHFPEHIKISPPSSANPTRPSMSSHADRNSPGQPTPNSLSNAPRQRNSGGTDTGNSPKSTDSSRNPAWPATTDGLPPPAFRHR